MKKKYRLPRKFKKYIKKRQKLQSKIISFLYSLHNTECKVGDIIKLEDYE